MLPGHPLLDAALRLGLSLLLALPLGWEREQRSPSAGLRTYPLLSACVCGFLLLGQRSAGGPAGQADVIFGVLGGLGFVGSGAVLKSPDGPAGLNTAVSLWTAGAIGAGVAFEGPLVSLAVAVLSTLALRAPSVAGRPKGPTS